MAVYVDDMFKFKIGSYRGMKMSHMVADSREELLEMADKIGLNKKWIQNQDTWREHFDIGLTLRKKAVENGAIEVSMKEALLILKQTT